MKKKRKITIILLAFILQISMIAATTTEVALGAGSDSSPGSGSIKKTGGDPDAVSEWKDQNKSAGNWTSWDKSEKALVVPQEYTSKVRFKSGKSKEGVLKNTSEDGPKSFKGGNEYNDTTKKWERLTSYPRNIDSNNYYSIDLENKLSDDKPYVEYKNYEYYDVNAKQTKYIDIRATVTKATHKVRYTSRYIALKGKEGVDTGFKYHFAYNNGNDLTDRLLFISKKCYGGFPRISMYNIGDLYVRTDFYEAGTDKKIDIKSNVTYTDIDNCQSMSFMIKKTEISGATKDTKLLFSMDKNGTENEYATYTCSSAANATGMQSPENAVSFGYSGNQFYTCYTSGQVTPIYSEKNGHWTYDHQVPNLGEPMGSEAYFGASRYSLFIPEPPEPVKYVFDKDEPEREEGGTWAEDIAGDDLPDSNTLDSSKETYSYVIEQRIPEGFGSHLGGGFEFDSFTMVDELDPCVEFAKPDDIRVYRDSLSNDNPPKNITDSFDISISGQRLTLTAKKSLLNLNDDPLFYGDGYGSVIRAAFKARLKDNITADQLKAHGHIDTESPFISFKNQAKRSIKVDDDSWTNISTNEVETNLKVPKPKKNDPEKRVTDRDGKTLTGNGDEIRVEENTLEKPDTPYTYHIKHKLGDGTGDVLSGGAYGAYWFFDSYVITDTVEDLLLIGDRVKVYQYTWSKDNNDPAESTRRDVTQDFDIDISEDKKTVTAAAKSDALEREDFYNVKMYELEFDCGIDTENYKNQEDLDSWATENTKGSDTILIKWPNKAAVEITDPEDEDDPDSEDGSGTWEKETNEVNTNLWISSTGGEEDELQPGITIEKTTHPYEFQVGEEIPYTITLKQDNEDAVAYKVQAKDTDFPEGFTIDESTLKAELSGKHKNRKEEWSDSSYTLEPAASEDEGGSGFEFATDYLYHGETITITFRGTADKTLNGTVFPNTVIGRSWGTHDDDESEWDSDYTSVYINSPKISITKEMDKKPDENGNINVSSGDPVKFKSVITNVNPGTFMRNLYIYDVFETKGLQLTPNSYKINYEDEEGDLTELKEGRDFVIQGFEDGADTVSLKKDDFDGKLGTKEMSRFPIETSQQTAPNTGDQLPESNHGGFIIKMLGRYRNLGFYEEKQPVTIPATEDERGQEATYMSSEGDGKMQEAEDEQEKNGSSEYSTDYEDLNLQGKLILTYQATVQEEGLKDVRNFIKAPATENTNNDLILNDDDLYIKGDPKVASGGDFARTRLDIPVSAEHTKDIQEEKYVDGDILHYTVKSENKGTELIKNVVLTDIFTTENAEYHKDSFRLKIGDNDITDKCEFQFSENNMSVVIETNRDLQAGEHITMTYTAAAKSEGNKIHNKSTFKADNAPEMTAEKDIPKGKGDGDKKPLVSSTQEGKIIPYEAFYVNNEEETWRNIFFEDEITTKNAKYNDDFKVWIGDEEITASCKVTIDNDNHKAKVETGRDLPKGKTIRTTYSVTALDSEQIDNRIVFKDPDHASDLYKATVPPVSHEKSVKEKQHQGPGSKADTLNYTLTSKNNSKTSPIKNVVITDEVLTKNLEHNKDIRITHNGKDITDKVKITYSQFGFRIETGMDLSPGDEFVTTYSGKVKDKELVRNETVLTADDIDGIKDEKEVPGPEKTPVLTEKKPEEPEPPVLIGKKVKPEEKGSLRHKKTVHAKTNSKGKTIRYTLKTTVKGGAEKVIITDTVKTKNYSYDKKSFKVLYNHKNITKKVKITIKKHMFVIKTSIDAVNGDIFKVNYSGKSTNGKKIDNISTAKGKNTNLAKDKATVDPEETPKSKASKPKTGDSFMPQIAGLIMIIAALLGMLVLFAVERKK